MKLLKSKYLVFSTCVSILLVISSCKVNIPDDIDALGEELKYNAREFVPYMGRTSTHENLISATNKTTLPLNFEILDIKDVDGVSVPNILDRKFPVKIWKKSYTGLEKSIEEIEAKRAIEYRPAIEIQKNSGNFIFWNTTSFLDLQTSPYEGYTMDIGISNSGGSKIDRGLKLRLMKERPYEPSEYDSNTGLAWGTYVYPTDYQYIRGVKTDLGANNIQVNVIKNYDKTSPGNTLTISVVDSLYNPIDIRKFNNTNWTGMIHGFNHRFEGPNAVYDVLYPLPIVKLKTPFTNSDGSKAVIMLKYNRLNSFELLEEAFVKFEFAIYEEGHWEIRFRFARELPKFDND